MDILDKTMYTMGIFIIFIGILLGFSSIVNVSPFVFGGAFVVFVLGIIMIYLSKH